MSGYELSLDHYHRQRQARIAANSARLAAIRDGLVQTVERDEHIARI